MKYNRRTAYILHGHAFARATTQGYIGAQTTRSKCPCCSTDRFTIYAVRLFFYLSTIRDKKARRNQNIHPKGANNSSYFQRTDCPEEGLLRLADKTPARKGICQGLATFVVLRSFDRCLSAGEKITGISLFAPEHWYLLDTPFKIRIVAGKELSAEFFRNPFCEKVLAASATSEWNLEK